MHKVFAIVALLVTSVASGITLVDSGKSAYTIIVEKNAPEVVKVAATELQKYILQATATTIPIAGEAAGPKIYVGGKPQVAMDLGSDGIVIKTVGDDLILSGGEPRGTINAVHSFLENNVGVRWWTSKDTFVPKTSLLVIPNIDISYAPPFMFRDPFYADMNYNTAFSVDSRCDGISPAIPASLGGHVEIIGSVHTFGQWLPASKYFAAHPEWYSLIDGKRVPDKQLCLTNPQMRDELLKVCLEQIQKNPSAHIISISQNDTFGPCQCDKCQAIAKREGSEAGPMIDLCNDLAERINRTHPGYMVHTLAYQYTRHPTKTLHASDHVVVQLCSIEADFSKPLRSPSNHAFGDDLRGWAKMAPHLFIWNYTTNFADYLIPQPNYFTQGDDLRFFAENHVIGVFQEGDYHNILCGDFLPMRTWVQAHLLWNPQQDQAKLTDEFLNGYFGAAGKFLRQYLDLVNAAAKQPSFKIRCYNKSTSFLTRAMIDQANVLFDSAEAAVKNDAALLHRVKRERIALDHVNLLRYDFKNADPGRIAEYKSKVLAFAKEAEAMGAHNYSEAEALSAYIPQLLARSDHLKSATKPSSPASTRATTKLAPQLAVKPATQPTTSVSKQSATKLAAKPSTRISVVELPKATTQSAPIVITAIAKPGAKSATLVSIDTHGLASAATTAPAQVVKSPYPAPPLHIVLPTEKIWGFNYDRSDDGKLLEEHWFDRWAELEKDFAEMHEMGANTVRIHLQVSAFLDSPTTGNTKNLLQLQKLLELAQKNNLKIDLTGLACYRKESVPEWFTDLPEQDRWNAQAKFWEIVAQAVANHPALFCYDLINEAAVPFEKHTSKDDWLAGHLADFWFCQRLVLDPGVRDRRKIAHEWTTKMIASIRKYDTQTPITTGMLPWPTAYPLDGVKDDLDFIAIHVYPNAKKVDEAVNMVKAFQFGKPVLIEETFPMACSREEEKEFLLAIRPTTMGVIGFFWGKTPQELRAKKDANVGDLITADWLDLFQEIRPR